MNEDTCIYLLWPLINTRPILLPLFFPGYFFNILNRLIEMTDHVNRPRQILFYFVYSRQSHILFLTGIVSMLLGALTASPVSTQWSDGSPVRCSGLELPVCTSIAATSASPSWTIWSSSLGASTASRPSITSSVTIPTMTNGMYNRSWHDGTGVLWHS